MTDSGWLDAIEARLRAATPGKWEATDPNEGSEYRPMWMVTNDAFHNPPEDDDDPWLALELHTGDKADAVFIAHAPEDIAALVAAVRERDAALAKLGLIVDCARCGRPTPSQGAYNTATNDAMDCCNRCEFEVGRDLGVEAETRADKAEAALARVEALADDYRSRGLHELSNAIRAALAGEDA